MGGTATSTGAVLLPTGQVGVGTARTRLEKETWNPFLARFDSTDRWEARVSIKELAKASVQQQGRTVECTDVSIEAEVDVSRRFSFLALVASLLGVFLIGQIPALSIARMQDGAFLLGFFMIAVVPGMTIYYGTKALLRRRALGQAAPREALEAKVSGILEGIEKALLTDSQA